MAAAFAKIVAGVAVVGVTVKQGVWGSNNQGVEAFEKVKRSVAPETTNYLQNVDVSSTISSTWNSGVKGFFSGVEHIPEYVKMAYDKAVNAIDKK